MAEMKYYGVLLTNDDGLPDVRVTAVCTVRGNQVFEISTGKNKLQFKVSPKGYLRAYPARKA